MPQTFSRSVRQLRVLIFSKNLGLGLFHQAVPVQDDKRDVNVGVSFTAARGAASVFSAQQELLCKGELRERGIHPPVCLRGSPPSSIRVLLSAECFCRAAAGVA